MRSSIAPQAGSKPLNDCRETVYRLSMSFLALSFLLVFPETAHAGSDPLSTTICLVVGWFTGGMGQAIATLGIVVLGIGAMMGKVSWPMALTVAFGVSVMFSGAQIVQILTSQNASFCVGDQGFGAGQIEGVLCTVASWANTATGRALGTLAIMFLGITALMGKVSAGLALTLAVGVGTVYGADDIGRALVQSAGGNWVECSPNASAGGS
jgi:type IV secretory pathway VirB2 component (pilin)